MHALHVLNPHAGRLAAVLALVAGALAVGDTSPAAAGGGFCHSGMNTGTISTGTGLTPEIRANCYTPTVLYVQPGNTVTWTNRDEVPHSVTGLHGAWGSPVQFGLGQSSRVEFGAAGTFPYYCIVHPMMQGVVVVGDGRASGTQPIVASVSPSSERAIEPAPAAAIAITTKSSTTSTELGWGLGGLVGGALITGAGMTLDRRRRGAPDR